MTASMESHCIPFREIPHTTKLFSSFLEDFSRVSSYYAHPPTAAGIDAAAREVRLDPATRRSVVEILREQNQRFAPGKQARSRNRAQSRPPRRGRRRDRHRPAGRPFFRSGVHLLQGSLRRSLRRGNHTPRHRRRSDFLARNRRSRSRRGQSFVLEHAQRPRPLRAARQTRRTPVATSAKLFSATRSSRSSPPRRRLSKALSPKTSLARSANPTRAAKPTARRSEN